MNYYKSQDGSVYAFDDDQVAAGLAADVLKMDEVEIHLHLNPPHLLTAAEREWRNSELSLTDIKINKLEDLGQNANTLREYRIALRDWPAHPNFPNAADRPLIKQ